MDLSDEAATQALGRALAGLARRGDIFALHGDLGAGKTVLARAFIGERRALAGLGGAEEVPSPTFTLVQHYEIADTPVWHFDLYRIAAPEEVYELAIEEAFADAISLIEWPDRMGVLLPRGRFDIELSYAGDGRRARLAGPGDWAAQIAARLKGAS